MLRICGLVNLGRMLHVPLANLIVRDQPENLPSTQCFNVTLCHFMLGELLFYQDNTHLCHLISYKKC